MDASRYFVRGVCFATDSPGLQAALANVYNTPERPRCMCVAGGVEMYVSKHKQYVIKRMPGTGLRHHAACPAYEPEHSVSGLGELIGEAVIEHSPEQVEIRVDFPFMRSPGRRVAAPETPNSVGDVHVTRRRMSLRALLHLLYERAGFNRWYPAMEGRRNQGVLHKYLGEAAQEIMVKGTPLADRLYVPEPFWPEQKAQIAMRRRQKLSILHVTAAAEQFKMAIVIGELSSVERSEAGHRMTLRHMADAPLSIDPKTWAKIEKTYGLILHARDADVGHKPRIIVAALIYAKVEHVYQVDTITMMMVSQQWLPLDGLYEIELLERLCRERRAFLKPLRYDAKSPASFPNALLLDVDDEPVHLHVLSPFSKPADRAVKEKAVASIGDSAWFWRTEEAMPALPVPRRLMKRLPKGAAPHHSENAK